MAAKELRLKGTVHDVGYRLFLLSEAERLPLERFDARNVLIEDQQCVLVRVEGVEEQMSQFVAFVESQYPPEAVVDSVEVTEYSGVVMSIESYRQSFMVSQLTKLAQTGVSMLGKQDAMLGKQDAMLGKQDAMLGKQDAMLGKQDAMLEKQDSILEKQDETVKTLKEESEKTRAIITTEGERTRAVLKGKIEEDIAWVKDEIIDIKATLGKVKEKVGVE
jgi:acylphosphatase